MVENLRRLIKIEQGTEGLNQSVKAEVSLENGSIVSVKGLTGITQFEDEVEFKIKDLKKFRLPSYLWCHYYSIILEVEENENALLSFEDGSSKTILALSDIEDKPKKLILNEHNQFHISNYTKGKTGILSIHPKTAVAGSLQEFEIVYHVGENGLKQGSSIKILTPYSCWSKPDFNQSKHLSVKTKENVTLVATLSPFFFSLRGNIYEIKVFDGNLSCGDQITIKYTNENQNGIKVQQYVQDKVYFLCWEDNSGNGIFYPHQLLSTAMVKIISGEPKRFRLKTKQIISDKENIEIAIRPLDEYFNPINQFEGKANLSIFNEENTLVLSTKILLNEEICKANCGKLSKGIYRLTVQGEGFYDENICIRVMDENVENIYYGELHAHSEVSDGSFGMEAYFDYGKDIGMLDFCALSDHDWEIVEHVRNSSFNGLERLGQLTKSYNKDDEFVTFCGYEWMGVGGHINAYFMQDEGNEVCVGHVSILGNEKLYPTMKEFISHYEGRKDVLLIPHFSHSFFYHYYDESLEPVSEIYSQWGFSEEKRAVYGKEGAIDHLNDGKKFGFISGADSHHGMPGQTGFHSKYSTLNFREGLTGVFAEKLTRNQIFNSIKSKRTYATTGERILLDFHINGSPMGSEIQLHNEKTVEAEIIVGGTREIESIEIIGNGDVIHRIGCFNQFVFCSKFNLQREIKNNEYYYVRVKQKDGNIAWSSPIWISGELL